MHGIPGCGKSTLVRELGLEAYSLSPDSIRMTMAAPVYREDGTVGVSQVNDREVWRLMGEFLEMRMQAGELIVVDATHTNSRYFSDYEKLVRRYRYKAYVVDFSGVPLDICKKQNLLRESYKIVPESALDRMHTNIKQTRISTKVFDVIKSDAMAETLDDEVVDLGQYKAIHHIGDIQGCYTPLAKYFEKYPLNPDEFYIFSGDLLDRGSENGEVLKYVCDVLADKPNVMFVEGNHDKYLWQWLIHEPIKAVEFNGRTKQQIEAADIDKAALARVFRKMRECFAYSYEGKRVLVSHGGISAWPERLSLVSAAQYVKGVGNYEDVGKIDDNFLATTDDNTYQIHGHRNRQDFPTQHNARCFNLEGKVEFGGELRTVQLSEKGFEVVEIENKHAVLQLHPENAAYVHSLRQNRLISERTFSGNISSFSFKPEVFFDKKWSAQTVRARGLFVNNFTHEIVIRSYDKFFNVGERRDTELSALKEKFAYPITAWVKENGYLGLLGYDAVSGELIFTSKSSMEGEFAEWFKQLFLAHCGNHVEYLKSYLAEHNVCLIFEVILPKKDPHIVSYDDDHIVLLDIVKRVQHFEPESDKDRDAIAKKLGINAKRSAAVLKNWTEFEDWYNSVQGIEYSLDGQTIEGFVLQDAADYHVKIKLDFYLFWKQMRTQLDRIKNGKEPRLPVECKYPELAQQVFALAQDLSPEKRVDLDIIALRDLYT